MKLEGTIVADEVKVKLKRITPEIMRHLVPGMTKLMIKVQSWIRRNKLSGDPLNRRKGRLSGSVNYRVIEGTGSVSGEVFVGPEAPYGAVHELGGTYWIPQHVRTIVQAWGRPISPRSVDVRGHDAVFPQRAFLVPAAEAHNKEFEQTMLTAAQKAIQAA